MNKKIEVKSSVFTVDYGYGGCIITLDIDDVISALAGVIVEENELPVFDSSVKVKDLTLDKLNKEIEEQS
jgi:hypothetical protein